MEIFKTCLVLLLATSFATAEEAPVVETLDGEISGVTEESTNGVTFYSYHAIPFAQPPVGELRFKNPVKSTPWEGLRDGSKFPPPCYQMSFLGFQTGKIEHLGDEDCLYLNIYTSKPNEELARLPVMVFIHGGGFVMGGTEEYPPHVLMNHDIVFATIQYRLGIFGFMSTEDEEAPGNLGLKDQTMALTWIQHNIHMFGGDATEVTIFGESAGSASVHFQILSPRALGLFKRAILHSGTALCPWAQGGAFKDVAEYTANNFNCSTDQGSKELVTCLQKIPAEKLAPVQWHFNIWHLNPFLFGPRVDGDYLPSDPEKLMKEGRHKRVDLIAGVTSHEGAFTSIAMYANEGLRTGMMLNFPEIGPVSLEFNEGDLSPLNQTIKIFDHYVGGVAIGAENVDNITRLYSDRYFTVCHDLTSALHAKNTARHRKKVYRYEFSYRGQHSIADLYNLDLGKDYVSHGDDLFYLFTGGPFFKPLETEDDIKMRDIMTSLWANFAKHGDPTPDDTLGFKWDPIANGRLDYLDLKLQPEMAEDKRVEVREFWSSLPLKQNFILNPEGVKNIVVTTVEEAEAAEAAAAEAAAAAAATAAASAKVDDPPKASEATKDQTEKKEEDATSEKNKKDEL